MSKSVKPRSGRQHRLRPLPSESRHGAEAHAYSQADLIRVFRLPATLIRSLAAAGFITRAARGGKTLYTFQDLLVLRMAGALKAANISTGKITEAFSTIRTLLPAGVALSSQALAASGKSVTVREGARVWETHSRQYALPLLGEVSSEPIALPTHVLVPPSRPSAMDQAEALYAQGHVLEASDPGAARDIYLEALRLHSDHLEARINLGRLLHLSGELKEAERVYRKSRTINALLSFNLAILLEDLEREEEAAAAYREALALDPLMHDAHFNLARLHEKANRPRDALRHLLAYRRHLVKYNDE
jgi:tetratricopeptide (TPR) repeat protein